MTLTPQKQDKKLSYAAWMYLISVWYRNYVINSLYNQNVVTN